MASRFALCIVLIILIWIYVRVGYIIWDCTLSTAASPSMNKPASETGLMGKDAEVTEIANAKRVCYYVIPRTGNGVSNLTVWDLDAYLCTHIIVGGAKIQNTTIVPLNDSDVQVYAQVVALKKVNPNLRILLCVATGFPDLVKDPRSVAIFAYNAREFLLKNNLDGIDLDWEFPAWPTWKRNSLEKKWFTYFVNQLNNALKLASHPPLLLSIAVGAPASIVDHSYQVEELAKLVDFASIMAYDYHMFQFYLPFTGFNAPLAKRHDELGYFGTLNIEWSTKYWLEKGMPKEKLVVGIPTYGRSWRLLSPAWYKLGSPAVGTGMLGGSVTYTEACTFVKEGAMSHFDQESKVPFAARGTDWISYENPESIRAKAYWIRSAGVAGIMTFDLNSDDWSGLCSGKKFELHNIIKDVFSP